LEDDPDIDVPIVERIAAGKAERASSRNLIPLRRERSRSIYSQAQRPEVEACLRRRTA
jgi:hypothetical protein